MKKIKMEIMLFISLMGVFALFFFILTLHQYMEIDRSKIFSQDVDPLPMKKPTVLESGFELPVEGATGYASISLNVRENVDDFSNVVLQLNPGDGFVILEETGDFWKIRRLNQEGYVRHKNCLINLPDVMPSIIYNISNSKASLMKSLGKNIPNITGQKLYDVYDFNERLNREEYAVPVLYSMAKKIAVAQRKALENKNTLVIYEAFRPADVQKAVVSNLMNLASQDMEVKEGISRSPWSTTWFINTGVSNHQKGLAIDVSLAKVIDTSKDQIGDYEYQKIEEYEEYEMPTPMHELSVLAVRFTVPISSASKTAWQTATFTDSMNTPVKELQTYCTDAGLTPLASEWWHYNDLDSVSEENGTGNFYITEIYSQVPKRSES